MDCTSAEIIEICCGKGIKKAHSPYLKTIVLSFLAGAFIALGYLVYVKTSAHMPDGIGHLVGSLLFPMGLVMILIGGGELFTGNILDLSVAFYAGKIKAYEVIRNWVLVFFGNALGAICVAFVFSHLLHLGEGEYGVFIESMAHHKISSSWIDLILSGIGCNVLVAMAVWMANGTNKYTAKIMVLWFPVMAFVFLGFQHSVANMFLLPAAVFAGYIEWISLLGNIPWVVIGNIIGGAIIVGGGYTLAYRSEKEKH